MKNHWLPLNRPESIYLVVRLKGALFSSSTLSGLIEHMVAGLLIWMTTNTSTFIRDSKPRRFVAIIEYAGTSLDPSEQFVRARMTSVSEADKTGNGKILANYREISPPSRAIVDDKIAMLKEAGIGEVYLLGNTSEPTCQITVGLKRVGMVLLGKLNPVAAAVKAGVEVESIAESGLIDFEQLVNFSQLEDKYLTISEV